MSKPLVFLDLDGVVADFVGGACALAGVPNAADYRAPKPGLVSYSMAEQTGCADIWARIQFRGEAFWRGLDVLPWAVPLMEYLEARCSDLWILTSPAQFKIAPAAVHGKMEWVWKHLGYPQHRVIPLSEKSLLAGRGRVLIDDSDEQVDAWREMGGYAVHVPQPWNRCHEAFCRGFAGQTDYAAAMMSILKPKLDAAFAHLE